MHHVPWEIKRKTWKFIGLAFYANITDLFETCSLSFCQFELFTPNTFFFVTSSDSAY